MAPAHPTLTSGRVFRRAMAALAAAAIAVPTLAITAASAEPVYDPPLSAAAGTTWTEGACAEDTGVTVASDTQGDAGAVVRCVTNEDGSPYSSANALQTFADADLVVVTQSTTSGPMVCQVNDAPATNPCDEWTGVWWSLWLGTTSDGWTGATSAANLIPAATDTFVGLSLVDGTTTAPAPRVETVLDGGSGGSEEPPTEEPPVEENPGEQDPEVETPVASEAAMAAGQFVSRELQAADHLIINWGFPDYGLTADLAMALGAIDPNHPDALAAGAQIAAGIGGYIGTDGETYAGAVAKSLVLALTLGQDPHDFGGVDLVEVLQGLETESGRFSDVSQWGDYSNTLTQSLAIIGLEGAGVGASQEAVDYLIDAQCADGGFALEPGAADCVGDPDATSFALQALLASPCATEDSVAAALAYLVGKQQPDGSLGGGTSTEGSNANSTGLAGGVFTAAGLEAEALAALEYLMSLQYDESFADALVGGLAYDATTYTAHAGLGDAAVVLDQDRRTTAQGFQGLSGVTYADLAGAFDNAPERACEDRTAEPGGDPTDEPTVTPTEPTQPTETPTVDDTAGGDGNDDPDETVAVPSVAPTARPAGGLAQTGADVAPLALLALLLVLTGGTAVVATTRGGIHR